ncbi:MAG: T9SS type A sorting domain-containing protein [Cyclobacteriaceae bacterium]
MLRNKLYICAFGLFLAFSTLAQDNQSIDGFGQTEPALKVEVYPNPTISDIVVEIKNGQFMKPTFEVRNMIGNKMLVEPEHLGNNKYKFDLKDLASGYYFVVVKDDLTRFKKAYRFLKN